MFKQKYSRRTVLLCCLLSLVTAFGIPAWLSTNTPEFGDNARRSLWKINDILMRTFSPSALANVGWLSTSAPERGDDENRSLQKINDILNTSVGAGALPVSVKAFGAKGDGSTDDTTAIQAALTYASANGVNVYFPATTTYYKLTTQLIGYDNITVYGDGYYSQVRQTGSGNSGKNVMVFSGKTNFVVRALHIKANGEFTITGGDASSSYNGIVLRDCKDGIIEDCFFTACALWSVFNYVSDRTIIRRNQFPDPGTGDVFSVQLQTTAIFSADSSGVRIEDNKIWKSSNNAWVNGIGVYQGITNSHVFARDTVVRRNSIRDCSQYGVLAYCTDGSKLFKTVIEANQIENVDGSYHHVSEGTTTTDFNSLTAAGTAIYNQNSLASSIKLNEIYNCNLFSRERGTLIKAGISGSGSPDLTAQGNKLEQCYHNGIYFNNSGLFGDYTNSVPKISMNEIFNCGTFINLGSITAGSTQLTLVNMTLPLQTVMSNYMAGGFIAGDKIAVTGAGAAGALFQTTIYSITNGIVNTLDAASTTVSSKSVVLSELGDTPPSINYGIKAAYVDRVSIVGNTVMLHDTNNLIAVLAASRSKGIGVIGLADGSNELILPDVSNNQIHGGYYGIELSGTRLANVVGNELNNNIQAGIQANNAFLFGRVNNNSIRATPSGIVLTSLSGQASGNSFRSVTTAITSSGARLSMNNFNGVTTEYGTDTPQQSAYASGTVYTLTATPALVDFGTTDPAITIPAGGAFVLTGGLNVKYVGATYAANQTCTVKLRKTSGTAADVTSATRTITLRIVTTITDDAGYVTIPPTVFNATAGDVVQVWASVSATPSAGSVTVDSAEILATPL